MSLATSRSKRQNAGQRMSDLINDEEDNEFYKNAYGGFDEEQEDNEFCVNEDEIEEDYVDSDFDIDETEENNNEEGNDEDEKTAKKKSVYKEPKPVVKKQQKTQDEQQPKKVKIVKSLKSVEMITTVDSGENKTLRNSTAIKRKELEERQKEREETKKSKGGSLKKSFENYRPTQEELLEEAYETEKINLASLDAYHKLEMAKKKSKFVKTGIKGPTIRYHSTIMPLYNETASSVLDNSQKQTRNFIIFSDESTLKENFPKSEAIVPQHKHCIITGLPAKYFDPVTQCPYANVYAYKILKDIYQQKQQNITTKT